MKILKIVHLDKKSFECPLYIHTLNLQNNYVRTSRKNRIFIVFQKKQMKKTL